MCSRCQGTARPMDRRPQEVVQVVSDKLEVEASFCYLGDMLFAAGGCELSTTTRVKAAWKKFKELLPVLSSCHLYYKTRGRVYISCFQNAMLNASETWPLTRPDLQSLRATTGPLSDRSAILSQSMWLLSDQTSCWLNLRLITSMES